MIITFSIALACLAGMLGYSAGGVRRDNIIKALRKSNSSLMADLSTGLTITTSQRDEYNRIVAEHKVLNEQQNEVISFLHENFRYLMDGRFSSFSQLVT